MFRRCARLPIALAALLFALSPSTLKAEGRPTPVSGRASLEDAPAASLSAPALVARGTERFRRGNYDGAIADFYAAYERQQVPTLLFNIAQAHRKSGRGQDALTVFEQFKLADPKSPLLPEVDAYIAELKAKQEAERAIADVWKSVLHIDDVGLDDHFFELGGDSLLTIRVHAQLSERLHRDLPMVALLQYPTVRSLAQHLAGGSDATAAADATMNRARQQRAAYARHRDLARKG